MEILEQRSRLTQKHRIFFHPLLSRSFLFPFSPLVVGGCFLAETTRSFIVEPLYAAHAFIQPNYTHRGPIRNSSSLPPGISYSLVSPSHPKAGSHAFQLQQQEKLWRNVDVARKGYLVRSNSIFDVRSIPFSRPSFVFSRQLSSERRRDGEKRFHHALMRWKVVHVWLDTEFYGTFADKGTNFIVI